MDASPPDPPPQTPLLNLHQLEVFSVIGYDGYLELLGDLIVEVPARLDQLRVCIQQGKAIERKAIAHSLRGILAYFGCAAINVRFAALEELETVPPEQAGAIDAELQTLWQDTLDAIRAWEMAKPGFGQDR